ncbi:MAG: hypothetical protein BGO90_15795 [Legionella sp. 40-6]|nr:TetR/AcrR family transcriptional regulator [Legionella sp.]OJX94583.1 MAG: hypothetical protein BGO90_15795 [Legionella sp. 40-6]
MTHSLIGTKAKALHISIQLLQKQGYEKLSFQQIAAELSIRAPSLYAHFQSKEELVSILLNEYLRHFEQWINSLSFLDAKMKLQALIERFYQFATTDNKICVLMALAGSLNNLPKSLRVQVQEAFTRQRLWVENNIRDGQKNSLFRKDFTAGELADLFLTSSYGSQSLARLASSPHLIRQNALTVLKMMSMETNRSTP